MRASHTWITDSFITPIFPCWGLGWWGGGAAALQREISEMEKISAGCYSYLKTRRCQRSWQSCLFLNCGKWHVWWELDGSRLAMRPHSLCQSLSDSLLGCTFKLKMHIHPTSTVLQFPSNLLATNKCSFEQMESGQNTDSISYLRKNHNNGK